MKGALAAEGLDGAWVRTIVLAPPKPDGHIGSETHSALMRLLDWAGAPFGE